LDESALTSPARRWRQQAVTSEEIDRPVSSDAFCKSWYTDGSIVRLGFAFFWPFLSDGRPILRGVFGMVLWVDLWPSTMLFQTDQSIFMRILNKDA